MLSYDHQGGGGWGGCINVLDEHFLYVTEDFGWLKIIDFKRFFLTLEEQNRVTAQAKRKFPLLSHTPANRNECPCCKHFLTTPANISILSLTLKNQNFKFVTLIRAPSQPVAWFLVVANRFRSPNGTGWSCSSWTSNRRDNCNDRTCYECRGVGCYEEILWKWTIWMLIWLVFLCFFNLNMLPPIPTFAHIQITHPDNLIHILVTWWWTKNMLEPYLGYFF